MKSDVRKNYPKISETDFREIVELDPTYKGNDSVGKYTKWLLNLYNKKRFVLKEKKNHIKDLLLQFEYKKKALKNRDIGYYKTLEQLEETLSNTQVELSKRQKLRQVTKQKHNINPEEEIITEYEDEDWIMQIPKTYAASCKLGEGTNWCTASKSNGWYFEHYKEKGDLHILTNKHNPKEKYQFHFESCQFMDKNDKSIDLKKILNKRIKKHITNKYKYFFIYNILYKKQGDKLIAKYCFGNSTPKFSKRTKIIVYSCFYYKKIKGNIIIPDSVEKIEDGAFDFMTNTKKIIISENSNLITIGRCAFNACLKLENILLPKHLQSIGLDAFFRCNNLLCVNNLSSLDIDDNPIKNGGVGKYALKIFKSANEYIDYFIKDNGYYAKYDNEIELLRINNTNTNEILIPNYVTRMGNNCLSKCRDVEKIIFERGSKLKYIDDYAFSNLNKLKSIKLPQTVETICVGAFCDCEELEEFYSCSNFKIKNISNGCLFEYCPNLKNVILKNNLNYILENNYLYTTDKQRLLWINPSLKNINLSNKIKDVYHGIFTNIKSIICHDVIDIKTLKDLGVTIYKNAAYIGNKDNPYLILLDTIVSQESQLEIHKKTKIILDFSIRGLYLRNITITNKKTIIQPNAFAYCYNLEKIIGVSKKQVKMIGRLYTPNVKFEIV